MLTNKTLTPERIRRLSREGIWIACGQVVAVVGALVGVRLLTEFLDPAAYGELALGMTAAALVNQVVLGPLGNGATRFYAPAVERDDVGGYLVAIRRLLLKATGGIGLILLVAVVGLVATKRPDLIGITAAALVFALVSGCNAILSGIQSAARQRSIVALHQGADPWTRFLVAAALMLMLQTTSVVAMWGYAAASVLVLTSQYRLFHKSVQARATASNAAPWTDQIWAYSWPFSTWGIFTWLQLASDRWALERFQTTQEVGLYVVLYQLGYYPITMATGMAVQFLSPIVYGRAGDAKNTVRNQAVNQLIWQLTALALGLTCIASLAAFAFHRQIFAIFVSKEYGSVSSLLPWIVFSGGLFAAGQTMALELMSLMKTRAMVGAKIATALLGVTLNVAGAYWYGTAGVVLANVLFSASYLVWMSILSRRFRLATPTERQQV
jgi:O-antigen/teichoic acid export membrane protein